MRARLALAAGLLLALAGCVTETSGRVSKPSSPAEAAQLNLELGSQYLRQGDLESARTKLVKAVEQNPKLVQAHMALGVVYERLDDAGGAERHYLRATELAPADPSALNGLAAYLCRRPGRREEAMTYFDRALAIPLSRTFSNKAVLNTNAGVCVKPLDLARAENYLRAAVRADPAYSEALIQLADVAYERTNYLQARAFLERYLGAAAADSSVLWLGVRIEQALGEGEAAARYATRLKRDFPASVETRLLLEQERDAG